jgi:Ca2+-binding RTX toxin-like protein
MFGFRFSVKCAAAALAAVFVASGSTPLQAQFSRRRETNANRRARIERTIQDTYSHKWEGGAGGGYLRFRSGEDLQRNNEVTFWVSGTRFFNPKLGILADVRGAYGNAKVGNTEFNIKNPQISQYTFMAGPNYRFYLREKMAASVFGTAGAGIGKFDSGSKGIPADQLGLWPSETRAVFSAGLNLDYNFYPNLAFRITPTYLGSTWGGTIQNNLGVNLGVVYRFGRIK